MELHSSSLNMYSPLPTHTHTHTHTYTHTHTHTARQCVILLIFFNKEPGALWAMSRHCVFKLLHRTVISSRVLLSSNLCYSCIGLSVLWRFKSNGLCLFSSVYILHSVTFS